MRDYALVVGFVVYVVVLAFWAIAIIVGLPAAVYHGLTSGGDWSWLVVWGIAAVVWMIGTRLGLIHGVND